MMPGGDMPCRASYPKQGPRRKRGPFDLKNPDLRLCLRQKRHAADGGAENLYQ